MHMVFDYILPALAVLTAVGLIVGFGYAGLREAGFAPVAAGAVALFALVAFIGWSLNR